MCSEQAWWHTLVILALGRQRQEDHHKFEASPGYIVSLRSTLTT